MNNFAIFFNLVKIAFFHLLIEQQPGCVHKVRSIVPSWIGDCNILIFFINDFSNRSKIDLNDFFTHFR